MVKVAALELESGIPRRRHPGALIEFFFFTHADPVVRATLCGKEVVQRLKFSEWLEGDISYRIIIEMMRAMAQETRAKRISSWERGARAGLQNFEVFMTGAFEGEHGFDIWSYDDETDKVYPFGRYATTEAVLRFCDELEALLDEDAIRRGENDEE